MTAPLVVLIGPPGAGKSRIGKAVARDLGVRFVDTDRVIVREHGPISAIFADHGEPHFRVIERETVRQALLGELVAPGDAPDRAAPSDTVLALGGGAILDPDTQSELAGHRVALITVTAEAVRDRLNTAKRPLLASGMESWERIANERRPLYEALATSVWDTSHRPVAHIAHELADWIRDATGLQKENQ